MDSLFPPDEKVDSPCIRVCCLNDDDICLGCFRSLEEITSWSSSSSMERKKIIESAEERRAMHEIELKLRK